jgi:hypothetical protein
VHFSLIMSRNGCFWVHFSSIVGRNGRFRGHFSSIVGRIRIALRPRTALRLYGVIKRKHLRCWTHTQVRPCIRNEYSPRSNFGEGQGVRKMTMQ